MVDEAAGLRARGQHMIVVTHLHMVISVIAKRENNINI